MCIAHSMNVRFQAVNKIYTRVHRYHGIAMSGSRYDNTHFALLAASGLSLLIVLHVSNHKHAD